MLGLALILAVALFALPAAAQEIQMGTYQEIARVLVDPQTDTAYSSITLQSSSTDEIRLSGSLLAHFDENPLLNSVFITSKAECIPGIGERSCLIINFQRDSAWTGIDAIHEGVKIEADSIIYDANRAFGKNAQMHSIYVHSEEDAISGIANPGTVTVAYSMPKESSDVLYKRLSTLLSDRLRSSGGFYTAASQIADFDGAEASFAIIRSGDTVLLQISSGRSHTTDMQDTVSPISLLGLERLERSGYFADGFYPLSSLLQVIVINASYVIAESSPPVMDTDSIGGVSVPVSFDSAGWVVDYYGRTIDAKYLFGEQMSANAQDVWLASEPYSVQNESAIMQYWPALAAAAAGAAAVIFAVKRRR